MRKKAILGNGLLGALVFFSSHGFAAEGNSNLEDELFSGNDSESSAPSTPKNENGSKDETTVGGRLDWNLDATFLKQTSWDKQPYTSNIYSLVHVDGRPNSKIRAFVQTSLRYFTKENPAINLQKKLAVDLDQAWLKFDVNDTAFFTLGKQPLKWGSSTIWNPTDFLSKTGKDPFSLYDDRAGRNMIKVNFPFEKSGSNLYFVTLLDDTGNLGEIAPALRAELVAGQAEVSLTGAVFRKDRGQVGADLSIGINDFDVTAEYAYTKFLKTHDERKNNHKVSLGASYVRKYSDDDTLTVGAETFYNSQGVSEKNKYLSLIMNGAFEPLHVAKYYAAEWIYLDKPWEFNNTTVILKHVHNISDHSGIGRLDMRYTLRNNANINGYIAKLYGGNQTEFMLANNLSHLLFGFGSTLAF